MGFELMTSSLPRMRSTPELHRLTFERGRRIELPFPAWKAGIIAIIRTPLFKGGRLCFRSNAWEEVDSNHRTRRSGFTVRRNCRYAILPRCCLTKSVSQFRADGRIRTVDPEITNHVLWPAELHRQYFKPFLKKDCKDRDYLRFSKKISIFFITDSSSIPQMRHCSSFPACRMNSSGMPMPSRAGAFSRLAKTSATAP